MTLVCCSDDDILGIGIGIGYWYRWRPIVLGMLHGIVLTLQIAEQYYVNRVEKQFRVKIYTRYIKKKQMYYKKISDLCPSLTKKLLH